MEIKSTGYFITGTDTEVGKTWSTVALMRYFQNQGKTVIGMKPVASGCRLQDGELKNEDALILRENASFEVQYADVNPYAFELPVSPHLAAAKSGVSVDISLIETKLGYLKSRADIVLVEGVGGWLVPLNENDKVEDLAIRLDLPVILVVAVKLGCINHAVLTHKAILAAGLRCAGWIASCTEPEMLCREENITTLSSLIQAPLLGVFPYVAQADFNQFAQRLNLESN